MNTIQKALVAAAALLVSLAANGCAVNIYNSQNVQDAGTAQSAQTATGATSRATNDDQPTRGKMKRSGKIITARKYKEGLRLLARGERVKAKSRAQTQMHMKDEHNRRKQVSGGKTDRTDTGHGRTERRTREKRDDTRGHGRQPERNATEDLPKSEKTQKEPTEKAVHTEKASRKRDRKQPAEKVRPKRERPRLEKDTAQAPQSDEVSYQVPPQTPPENEFGYETPVYGCFEGEVIFVPANTRKLPENFDEYEVAAVLYACEWDIAPRAFDKGFPGVETQFEWFAIRYTGAFGVSESGTYTFRINSDDGARLFIDGKEVLDNDGVHPPRSKSAKVHLQAGDHDMRIEYFQGPRYEIALQLYVTPPDGAEEIFSVR
ncbi:MAG: hypothetical protein JXX14_22160 [Deltaproteobacteria bacterium]|nr:hypothetical protein [Deltaproteobacteria bacterium]